MNIGDWPVDLLPYQWEFYLQPNTRSFVSPITRTRQVLSGQGKRYVGTGSWRFADRRDSQRFEAQLDKLDGQVNTVNIWDFGHRDGLPLGPALSLAALPVTEFTDGFRFTDGTAFAGGPQGYTIVGAHAIGDDVVVVRGFPPETPQLYAGDHVGIGGYLYRLTEDQPDPDGLSRASLSLNRPLVTAAAHGAAVTTSRPRTPMQLLDDDQSRRVIGVGAVREYTVSFIEVL